MGIGLSKLFSFLTPGGKDVRCVMLGLDAAGKSTLLFKMKFGEIVHTIPTIGFNVETVEYKNLKFTVWDVGGQDRLRPLWRHYYENTHAVIYVVDSNDPGRLEESRDELHKLLAEDQLKEAHLLVFANKQDLKGVASAHDIADQLELHKLRGRNWYIQACSAVTNEGVYEGMDWLASNLRR